MIKPMKQRGYLLALGSLVLLTFAACGSVTQSADGGMTGAAGTGATGSAGTSGAAGTKGGAGTSGTGAAGTGASAGTNGHAGTGAAGTMGAAGSQGQRPCLDTECAGTCMGTTCAGAWTCDTSAMICTLDIAEYCGCDGQTFTASGSCPNRAFSKRGACDVAPVSCDPRKIICKRAAPICGVGEVPSVEGTCYGPCVPLESCTCAAPAACPNPNQNTCHMNTMRCGPYVI